MNTLELFAGSRSFSKVAKKLGHNVYTTDKEPFKNIDVVCDIFDFNPYKLPYKPDIIWASPPCTFFSVASIGKHWNKDHTPKTKEAILGKQIIKRTLLIIKLLNPKYYYIENPRGKLRKLPIMNVTDKRNTIWYCKYSSPDGEDHRAKPTDIWTNDLLWIPRSECYNGNVHCHHQPAPRGSQSGTQGMKTTYEKSKIPEQLFYEILEDKKD